MCFRFLSVGVLIVAAAALCHAECPCDTVAADAVVAKGARTPAAHGLARRGMIDNVGSFALAPDAHEPSPQAQLIDAVAEGRLDVAISWGPPAGYFARKLEKDHGIELAVVPVSPELDAGILP